MAEVAAALAPYVAGSSPVVSGLPHHIDVGRQPVDGYVRGKGRRLERIALAAGLVLVLLVVAGWGG